MVNYLLDTDALIDYLAGVATSVTLLQDLHGRGDLLCVSDVVIAEVYAGLRPRDQEKAVPLLSSCYFLPTGPEEAKQAGKWRFDFARRGIALSTTDVLVAATAQGHNATIVTGNTQDYPMDEVTVLPLPRVRQ